MAKICFMLSYYHFCFWILVFLAQEYLMKLENCYFKAIKASMSSLRSEFIRLRKFGSLQSILQAACDLIEPEMLWVKSENAKRRLEAIVEAMDENIENK